jgi:hypothetical protein
LGAQRASGRPRTRVISSLIGRAGGAAREKVPAAQAVQTRGEVEAVKVPAGQPAEMEKQDVTPRAPPVEVPGGQERQSESSVAAEILL